VRPTDVFPAHARQRRPVALPFAEHFFNDDTESKTRFGSAAAGRLIARQVFVDSWFPMIADITGLR
jgi:hypothetical protein